MKAQSFDQGLTLTLQSKLGGVTFETLDEIYGRATNLNGMKRRELEGTSTGKKRKYNSNGNQQSGSKKTKPNGGFNQNEKDNRYPSQNPNEIKGIGRKLREPFSTKICDKNHHAKGLWG